MRHTIAASAVILLLTGFLPDYALAGQPAPRDYGDAPEGVLAYPSTGQSGAFPSCKSTGPALFAEHNNFGAWFGPAIDLDSEGNGGLCPGFAPYDNDECFNDGDAGLLTPPAYTTTKKIFKD